MKNVYKATFYDMLTEEDSSCIEYANESTYSELEGDY